MYRSLAALTLATGLAVSVAPAHARTDPIRGFEVSVKGEQIRAWALVPGPVGRRAQLQQLDGGRWVTIGQTRTKAAGQGTPRARWRVSIEDLRLGSSRAQAGPLAELIRLRAQAGKAKSPQKKVRVKLPDLDPLLPKVVTGFIGSQAVGQGAESLWSGEVRFEYNDASSTGLPTYNLVSANLAWQVELQGSCTITASGTFTAADLKGEGTISVPSRVKREPANYQFRVTRDGPVTIPVNCGSQSGSFDYVLPLYLNTLKCPSASNKPGTIPSTYTGQPWTNREPPYVLFGKVGLTQSGFCSDTLQPPGIFQSWDLTGSDLFEYKEWLAPLAK